MYLKYSSRDETETDRKHWDHKGSWGSGGATVAVKVSGGYSL